MSFDNFPPRYSTFPFPDYAYLPGRDPHPTADRSGHSFHCAPWFAVQAPPSPDQWLVCRPYLYGVDLFNFGYWWEAHESWEPLWRGCVANWVQRKFLQGLIQAANTLLKRQMGKEPAADRLCSECWNHLSLVHSPRFMGLDVHCWLHCFEYYVSEGNASFPALILRQ